MTDIVNWSASAAPIEGSIWQITITGEIAQGYHIYDLTEHEFGTTPTVIRFDCGEGASTVGDVQIACPVDTHFEDVLGFEIGTISGNAQFSQNVELNETEAADVNVTIEWQACTDRECTPPDEVSLNVHIGVPAVPGEIAVTEHGNAFSWGVGCGIICGLLAIGVTAAICRKKRK